MSGFLLPLDLQYFTNQGVILAGGSVNTYTGGTTTPVTTFTDSTLGTSNGTSVTLDSSGRMPNGMWVPAGQLTKIIVKTSGGVQVGPTLDNVPGINDTTTSGLSGSSSAGGIGTTQGISVQQSLDNLRNDQPSWCGTATGTANALALTPSPAFTAYQAGQRFRFIAAANNTAATTAAISGLAALSVKKNAGGGIVALAGGEIQAGDTYELWATTPTQLVLINPNSAVAASSTSQGLYSARGLFCFNNATTPNTKFDLTAAAITLWGVSDKSTVTIPSPTGQTNDIGAASPAAGARDQGAAFTDPSYIHFYWIYNSTTGTLSSISSATPPPAGPTLPTGYTHYSYVGGVRYSAGALKTVHVVGNRVFYDNNPSIAASLTATVETTVSLAAFAPVNALSVTVGFDASLTTTAGGAASSGFLTRILTGINFDSWTVFTPVASQTNANSRTVTFPVLSSTPQFLYLWGSTGGNISAESAAANMLSYNVPNGAT